MLAAEFLRYLGGSHAFIIARTVEANGKGLSLLLPVFDANARSELQSMPLLEKMPGRASLIRGRGDWSPG